MLLIRYSQGGSEPRFGAVVDGRVIELEAAGGGLHALLTGGAPVEETFAALARRVEKGSSGFSAAGLLEEGRIRVDGVEITLERPIDRQEVWAAGVTYKRSEEARKAESEGAARFYEAVYDADRPELFFKAPPHRCVGHLDHVGIRSDSRWNVPEPELGVVLTAKLEIFGYTIGNDMSSRDIEGANPLYLPQAKVYDRSLALGPGILIAPAVANPRDLEIRLRIVRSGSVAFEGATSTARMKRSIDELVAYLGRAATFPDGVVLLTGTGIVPDDEFSLRETDIVEIDIEGIGRLQNPVIRVGRDG